MIKVADLGVCNEFLGDDASIDQRTATGTPAFRAPETLFRDGQKVYFDGKSADGEKSKDSRLCFKTNDFLAVWSLGITLFAFLYGDVPFKSPTIPVLYEQIKNEEPVFPVKPVISEGVKDLISKMLNKDPEQRANMQLIKVSSLSDDVDDKAN